MYNPVAKGYRRFYISLPVDDEDALDILGDIAERIKLQLWPATGDSEERRKYSVFNRQRVHVTLWTCDLAIGEDVLKDRLEAFMYRNRGCFTDLRIRFNKLSYLAKTETRYIVACLDPPCRERVQQLKHRLEKAFSDFGRSLLERDTCQLHCSIVAYTNFNVPATLPDVLSTFRTSIAEVGDIFPTRLIVTSKWQVLASGTFHDGFVTFDPVDQNAAPNSVRNLAGVNDPERTVELINFPVHPSEDPKWLLQRISGIVGYPLSADQIRSCRRRPSPFAARSAPGRDQRAPDIVAVLSSREVRDSFLEYVKLYWKQNEFSVSANQIDERLGDNRVSVVAQLPDEKKLLYGKAKRFKIENNFKFCWLDDDRVYLRKNDASRIYTVCRMEDLQNLIDKVAQAKHNSCCVTT